MSDFTYNPDIDKEFISLYDFLGHPAGGELGTKVWEAAHTAGEPHRTKHVETMKYQGKILMYRESFLHQYFNSKGEEQQNSNES